MTFAFAVTMMAAQKRKAKAKKADLESEPPPLLDQVAFPNTNCIQHMQHIYLDIMDM